MSGSLPDTRERWRHRLPHWEVADRPHFVTIRCAGSLPADALARVREIHADLATVEPASPQFAILQRQYFATCEKYLDRGEGFAPFTAEAGRAAASAVLAAWAGLDAEAGWRVTAAVAMPNHVHFILQPVRAAPEPLRTTLRTWKGRTARLANLALGRRGAFWQEDWFDRWLRTAHEETRVTDYILQNPVKAGLARTWMDWPWTIAPPHP
jgi:REP element-mobilizing transposase RayT